MIHFLAGLPRSGSTLLGALLNQNARLHVTPTNDLIAMMLSIRSNWVSFDSFRAQGLEGLQPRIRSSIAGMLRGFYEIELSKGISILDKNRGWPAYIEVLEDVLGRNIRIICPVRDLKDIVASFERLRSKHPLTAVYGTGSEYYQQQTILGRAQFLLSSNGTIGLAYRIIVDAMARGKQNRFCFVPYSAILETPQLICTQIFSFLGIKPCEIDFENIIGPDTSRDIDIWGLPLHKIRPVIEDQTQPWEEILPSYVGQWIDNEFPNLVQNSTKQYKTV